LSFFATFTTVTFPWSAHNRRNEGEVKSRIERRRVSDGHSLA
jgi:hypothetical protein